MVIIENGSYYRKIIEFLRYYKYYSNDVSYLYQVRLCILDDGTIEKTYTRYNIVRETYDEKFVVQGNESLTTIKRNQIYYLQKKPIFSQDNKMMTLNILSPSKAFFENRVEDFFEILDCHLLELIERRFPRYNELKRLVDKYNKEISAIEKVIDLTQKMIIQKSIV